MYVFVYTANIQTYFLKNKLLFIINAIFMKISNSDEKFTPTVDWIADKYFELNEWLFNGRLGNCLFEIFTTGEGMETSLGHFRLTGRSVKYNKRTRQMFYVSYDHKENIDADNFALYTKPMIGLNGNYKRTEHMWLNTLVHEMCHYYTYMGGRVPIQAHGTEFRQIASIVGIRSNGIFDIKRLCDAVNAGELDGKIASRRHARDENKKSKMTALFLFMRNGEVRLVTTTKQSLVDEIVSKSDGHVCKKIVATSDANFIEYLWSLGYKKNRLTYRYWPLENNSVLDELKKYSTKTLKSYENMLENVQLTMEDINFMVESALNKILGKENDMVDITPDMILSDDSGLMK